MQTRTGPQGAGGKDSKLSTDTRIVEALPAKSHSEDADPRSGRMWWVSMRIGDWYSDTKGLSLIARAAYLELFFAACTKQAPIEDSPTVCANLIGCHIRTWKRIRDELLTAGIVYSHDGFLHDRRAAAAVANFRQRSARNTLNASGPRKLVADAGLQEASK